MGLALDSLSGNAQVRGTYTVKKGRHYVGGWVGGGFWGFNSQANMSVGIVLSPSTATYNCSNVNGYSCPDTQGWMFDFNKLWGKARCGFLNSHHDDSDRFVWRRCSDKSCSAWKGYDSVQLAAYSYDNKIPAYTPEGQAAGLLKIFDNTIVPGVRYVISIDMSVSGLSTFILADTNGKKYDMQKMCYNLLYYCLLSSVLHIYIYTYIHTCMCIFAFYSYPSY